jgi:hypothetical protein
MAASFMNEYNMITTTTVYWWLLLVLLMVSGLTLVSSIKLANCIWNILRSGHCYLWFCCYEIRYQYYDTMEGHRERDDALYCLLCLVCFLLVALLLLVVVYYTTFTCFLVLASRILLVWLLSQKESFGKSWKIGGQIQLMISNHPPPLSVISTAHT